MPFTDHEVDVLKQLVRAVDDRNSNGGFAGPAIDLVRSHRGGPNNPHHRHTDGEVPDHTHATGGPLP